VGQRWTNGDRSGGYPECDRILTISAAPPMVGFVKSAGHGDVMPSLVVMLTHTERHGRAQAKYVQSQRSRE
jgi:hypothetical protein